MLTRSAHQALEMDAIPSLPNELWTQVFQYLSKADLKSVRLCGKRKLEILASPLLFTTAYVAARRGVLDTFTELTTHPVFRDYVKEVIYDSSWIAPEVMNRYDEGPQVLEQYEDGDDEDGDDEDGDDKCGPSLASMFYEQERIQKNEMQSRLDNAFHNLSAVTKVRYADLSRVSYLPGDRNDPICQGDYQDGPLPRRIESGAWISEFDACYLKLETAPGRPRYINGTSRASDNDFRRQHSGLRLLMQALAKSSTAKITQLSLGDKVHACWEGGVTHWFFSSITQADTYPFFLPVFRYLRRLDLTISILYESTDYLPRISSTVPRNPAQSINLVQLLSSAEYLEELKLVGQNNTAYLRLDNTLANSTWQKLRAIHLDCFTARISELEDFLKRHASSLRYLTLDAFNLSSGTWKDLGAAVAVIAPEVQLVLGIVADGKKWVKIENYLPLADLGLSGPITHDNRKGDESDDYDDGEDGSSSDNLEYSSDDSSSETDEPRRNPDADFLVGMDAELRRKVEYLRKELPGYPVQECQRMLEECKNDQKMARLGMMTRFGYRQPDAEILELRAEIAEMRAKVECLVG